MASAVKTEPQAAVRSRVRSAIAELARKGITVPRPGQKPNFRQDSLWRALQSLGTELWLDTGDLEKAEELWTDHFSALTTNNTLLSKEVKKGIYDELIKEAVRAVRSVAPDTDDAGLVREIGILLNARHGLRLVEKFACRVSVELHTDLAHDLQATIETAHRLYDICPEYFIVKVPLTPTGILSVRRLVREGLPINFTLEFSARQNYIAARVAQPHFVNVFLGRLNSFVADFKMGDGKFVGEKATLSSQNELLKLRESQISRTRQIAASMREPGQIATLAGVDVHTMPTAVAEGFLKLGIKPQDLSRQIQRALTVNLNPEIRENDVGLDTLWEVPDSLKNTVSQFLKENLDAYSATDLAEFFTRHGFGDVFPAWTSADLDNIAKDGKIPSYPRWKELLKSRSVGLDALFNAAGLLSFAADQKQLDDRIRSFLNY